MTSSMTSSMGLALDDDIEDSGVTSLKL